MKNGWNYEYLQFKKQQLEKRLNETKDLVKRKALEEDIELVCFLSLILLFSNGEVLYTKVTMDTFVSKIYEQDFLHKIPASELKRIVQTTLSLLELPRLNIEELKTHISFEESIEIVGEFIKEKFGDKVYKLYKSAMISDYVLFDSGSALSDVICLDGEFFLRIAKTEDIRMLSAIGHEFGHIYRILNNNNIISNYYREYESFFCEFNLLLWLMKNNIYSKESANHFLYLFDLMEKILIMRNFIIEYQLNKINDSIKFSKTINQFQIKERLNIRSDQDFFNVYSTTIDTDLLTYYNSFMGAINNIDDFDKYDQVIRNIKSDNEDYIKTKILNQNKGEYDSYLRYRKFLQS